MTSASRRKQRSGPEGPLPSISEHDGVRYLHLGGTVWVQGGMRLRAPSRIELEYVRRMMAWLLLRDGRRITGAHAVQLGLGAGAITRYCLRVLGMRCTAVEVNPLVVRACQAWFHLPFDTDDCRAEVADAAAWLADPAHAGSADVLCVDLYDEQAAGPVHDAADFYAACREVLADDGIFTVNLFGRDARFERSLERIVAAFGAGRVARIEPTAEGNAVVLAWRGFDFPSAATLARRAANIDTRFGLPAARWLPLLHPIE